MSLHAAIVIRTAPLAGDRRPTVNGWRAVLVVGLALLATGGCTARLVYERLDTFAAWYVEDYLELRSTQRDELGDVLAAQLDWHRSTQLPAYADTLAQVQAEAVQPLGRDRIDSLRREVDGYWREIVANGLPAATAFMTGLTDDQVAAMFEEFARQDAKQAKKQAARTPERRLAERSRRVVRAFERWTGPLDDAQRTQVGAALAAAAPLDDEWLANRARWREQFRAALARRGDAPAFRAEVERLFLDPGTAWTPEYRAALERNRETYVGMIADVDASLTAQQRAHLRERLGTWAADLRALHASGA